MVTAPEGTEAGSKFDVDVDVDEHLQIAGLAVEFDFVGQPNAVDQPEFHEGWYSFWNRIE